MSLTGQSFEQLEECLVADGLSRVHGLPLFKALHQDLERSPEKLEVLSPPLRRWLRDRGGAPGCAPRLSEEIASEDGWTRKYLLELQDQTEVEVVLMGFPGRFTACISTQEGCAMGCVFCATGQMGFRRHLSVEEIVAQVHYVEREVRRRHYDRIRNIVLMGMGEPLHNFEGSIHALEILTDTRGLNIGPQRVTISTVGHVPGILRLARHPKRYNLVVSLHGSTDEERQAIVPVNRKWPLAEVLEACREYGSLKKQRIFFAWTLIEGVNDSTAHARRLAELLRGLDAHVNLIPLNPTDQFSGEQPGQERVAAFQKELRNAGLPSTVRQRRGIDVAAGCGQLRSRASCSG